MTYLKFSILEKLRNLPNREAHRKTLMEINKNNPSEILSAINDLVELGYVEKETCSDKYKLTISGAEAYENTQDIHKRDAKQKRQNRISMVLAILTLTATVILSDPFVKFVQWLINQI